MLVGSRHDQFCNVGTFQNIRTKNEMKKGEEIEKTHDFTKSAYSSVVDSHVGLVTTRGILRIRVCSNCVSEIICYEEKVMR